MGIDKINTSSQMYSGKSAANISVKVPDTKPVKQEKAVSREVAPTPQPEVRKKDSPSPVKQRMDADQKIEERNEALLEESKKVKNAIAEVNRKMNQKTRCEFAYHEDTKRVSIKVIDSETDEVIREIPPEETLDMLSKMWEVAGILIDVQK